MSKGGALSFVPSPDAGTPAGQHVSPFLGMDPAERRAAAEQRLGRGDMARDDDDPARLISQSFAKVLDADGLAQLDALLDLLEAEGGDTVESLLSPILVRAVDEQLLSWCAPGDPTDDLAEILGGLTKNELVRRARERGVKYAAKHKKAELAGLIAEDIGLKATALVNSLRAEGGEAVRAVGRLARAGGRIDFSIEGDEPDASFVPRPPISFLFATSRGFAIVMPKVVLDTFKDVDWEAEAEAAERCTGAFLFLERVVELRGMAPFNEAYAEYSEHEDDLPLKEEVADGLDSPFHVGSTIAVKDGDRTWVASDAFLNADGTVNDTWLDRVVSGQKAFRPRPLSAEMLKDADLIDWTCRSEAGRALVGYLDAHVPDGADDCLFAWDLMGEAFACARDPEDGLASFLRVLYHDGLKLTGAQLGEVATLFEAYARSVPLWELNGWSRDDKLRMSFAVDGTDIFEHDPERRMSLAFPDSSEPDEGDASLGEELTWADDYEDEYDKAIERYRNENDAHLGEFEEWLGRKGLKASTINRHLSNVSFYLNEFMQYYDPHPMADGVGMVGEFLGNWFIRKAMWSTPKTIRQSAASIKKFYTCMCELGHVRQSELDYLLLDIKEGLDEWCETCAEYNSGVSPSSLFEPF